MPALNKAGKVIGTIYTSTATFTDEIVDGARKLETTKNAIKHKVKMSEMENNLGVIAKLSESSMVSSLHGLLRLEDNTTKADAITARQIGMIHGTNREAIRRGRRELENQYQMWQQQIASGAFANNPGEFAQVQARMREIRQEQAGLLAQQAKSYIAEGLAYGKRFLQHTFAEGTTMDRVKKATAYGGIYMGGNIALRGLTGGGVTYNYDGERDIAGIPFV